MLRRKTEQGKEWETARHVGEGREGSFNWTHQGLALQGLGQLESILAGQPALPGIEPLGGSSLLGFWGLPVTIVLTQGFLAPCFSSSTFRYQFI